MMRGVPLPRQVAEPPYRHRRGWVERPEHSGVVKLKPIVTAAIGSAWGTVQRASPHLAAAVGGDVEVLQHHPDLRDDFAELVAVQMAIVAQRFPTRYVQVAQRAHNQIDLLNAIHRLHTKQLQPGHKTWRRLPHQSAAAAAARERVHVTVPDIRRPTYRGGFFIV
jgi:hypothetical protein